MKTVHLIDDDPAILNALFMQLEFEGFETTIHKSAAHFLSIIDEAQCAGCVVTDVDMPGMSGLELAAESRNEELVARSS